MKNLVLVIAASLVSFTSFSQDQIGEVFSLYEFNRDGIANAYEKVYYNSTKDGNPIAYFWGDYTSEGIDIIVEEANRILSIFDTSKHKLFTREDFLIDGMFDAGEGDGNSYKVTFSDGSYMEIGAFDANEYKPDWGHVKVMELYFKHNKE